MPPHSITSSSIRRTNFVGRLGLPIPHMFSALIILTLAQLISAENCTTPADSYVGNAQSYFSVLSWYRRGVCLRHSDDTKCYEALEAFLRNGTSTIRSAEYAGAAGVLALLPTIGALLGAPTNEIWRFMTMVPFGGALSIALSFGGAILPTKIDDYESDLVKSHDNTMPARRLTRRGTSESGAALLSNRPGGVSKQIEERVQTLLDQVRKRLHADHRVKVPVNYIWTGLIGMVLLLCGAQAAMAIVEQGAILPWWCASRWWIHLWYMMVIATAAVDNWAQFPFMKQWTLILSDIPYNVRVIDGESITAGRDTPERNVGRNLGQLSTLRPGQIQIMGSRYSAISRNTQFIMISVIDPKKRRWPAFLRACSQLSSIGVFITGTAMFASAQLLSIAMATFVLTLVLAAAVFGRTIAGWIVAGIEESEPMIHFVAHKEEEAHYAITRILTLQLELKENENEDLTGTDTGVDSSELGEGYACVGSETANPTESTQRFLSTQGNRTLAESRGLNVETRQIQVDIDGHIFVGQMRIAKRSRFLRLVLGILAPPYKLTEVVNKDGIELYP